MIRKTFIAVLVFLAVLFVIIGSGSIVASLTGESLDSEYMHAPFLSCGEWSMEVIIDAQDFYLGLFQRLNDTGVDRDGLYVFRNSPRLVFAWQEYFHDQGGYSAYHVQASPTAAFILAAILGFYPAWVFLTPRLRRLCRRRRGLCVKCGYNLTGNSTGICPECGSQFDARRALPGIEPAARR